MAVRQWNICLSASVLHLLVGGRSRVRIPLVPGFFRGRVIPVTWKLALQWLPCQTPGVTGSALGLAGKVSVYCDWVRWKVWSAISISVWQHVKLSERIRPGDTLACCWDVKQPTNNTPPPFPPSPTTSCSGRECGQPTPQWLTSSTAT